MSLSLYFFKKSLYVKPIYILFVIFLCFAYTTSSYAIDTGITRYSSPMYKKPAILPTRQVTIHEDSFYDRSFSCTSIIDGAFLNCKFMMRIVGLRSPNSSPENNGGHNHDFNSHPAVLDDPAVNWDGALYSEYDEAVDVGEELIVKGQTKPTPTSYAASVLHEMPEVAGAIEIEAIVTSQRGWYCVLECFTRTSTRYISTVKVGFKELSSLPDPTDGDKYEKVRGQPDSTHLDRDAFYGTTEALNAIPLIGYFYNLMSVTPLTPDTNKKLSINDMSLPAGGMFDWKVKNGATAWKKESSHQTHRNGKDADLNRLRHNPEIDCIGDLPLRRAVNTVLPRVTTSSGATRDALICERNNREHIDIEL